jgi:hypothetical protein
MNFITAPSNKQVDFFIDGHPIGIYEVDVAYVEPREFVAAGNYHLERERVSAVIKLTKPLAITPSAFRTQVQPRSSQSSAIWCRGTHVALTIKSLMGYSGKFGAIREKNQMNFLENSTRAIMAIAWP